MLIVDSSFSSLVNMSALKMSGRPLAYLCHGSNVIRWSVIVLHQSMKVLTCSKWGDVNYSWRNASRSQVLSCTRASLTKISLFIFIQGVILQLGPLERLYFVKIRFYP